MHVIATAGHVDHGKSTLVQALTGSDPDRLVEEHRRGLSIELGYCWTTLPGAGDVAFVDVPGHERFISTMLAGVGPAPAVLFVVAADDPWMPQSAEHLAALHALGVEHGVLAVTRSDLADPAPASERALAEFRRTSMGRVRAVFVSGRTGEGLDDLRAALAELVTSLQQPDAAADVRLWVDRRFHVRGAGTVVTGTLPAGTIRVGDSLAFGRELVRVRGIESLGRPVTEVSGVARVALNLGGNAPAGLERGSVLVSPDRWLLAGVIDVRISGEDIDRPPERPLLHIGATSVGVHARPLSDDLVRLTLDRPLPLRIGDRALLRDPGSRSLWGVTVLDPEPPPLRRRGAAARRAKALADHDGAAGLAGEARRRGTVRLSLLRRIGVDTTGADELGVLAGDWLLYADRAAAASRELERLVDQHDRREPLDPGLSIGAASRSLGLPAPELVAGLLTPRLRMAAGKVRATRSAGLPARLLVALGQLEADLAVQPFAAPDAARLTDLGLDARAIGAAGKAGRLLRVSDTIVLLPGADALAAQRLSELSQPFTTSEARSALGTTRRVALPLLEHLDRCGFTRRLPDDRRTTQPPPATAAVRLFAGDGCGGGESG